MKTRHNQRIVLLPWIWAILIVAMAGCASTTTTGLHGPNEVKNEAAVKRLVEEVYHQGNTAVLDEFLAEGCSFLDNEKMLMSKGSVKYRFTKTLSQFRNINVTIDDLFASGDMVVTRATFQGNSVRNGKEVTFRSITITKFENGKIIEAWQAYDNASIYQQLGLQKR